MQQVLAVGVIVGIFVGVFVGNAVGNNVGVFVVGYNDGNNVVGFVDVVSKNNVTDCSSINRSPFKIVKHLLLS